MSDEKKVYKLSDDVIAVLRELVQLSLLTGTNLVDHLRAVQVEVAEDKIFPTVDYIEQYNSYIEDLEKQAEEMQSKMQEQIASDEPKGPLN